MKKLKQLMKQMVQNFKDTDKILLFVMLFLSIFGLFNIVSASSREAVVNMDQDVYYFFYKHLIILIGSFIAFFALCNIETKKYRGFILILFPLAVVANAFLAFSQTFTRGASNWINLGFFNLQPSELAKPVIIVALALFMEMFWRRFRNPKIKHWNLIGILGVIGLIIPTFVFAQKDLGTAIIQVSIFGFMFLLSPIMSKEKWKTIGIGICSLVFVILFVFAIKGEILSKAQMERFNFIDPCSKYSDTGYQVCNAYIAINLGGLSGVGIGKSTQKYSYIPEAHTDMVFAIFAEEYGLIAGLVLLILYAIILWRILILSSKASTIRGKFICLGVGVYIFSHIFVNLGGMFGLIPLTGVPLPFLSYGGSFTLSLIAALGLVQRVHIETKQYKLKF